VAPLVVAVTGFVENDTLVFAGFPVALKVTELVAPVIVMVAFPELPRRTVSDDGEAEMVKSGVGAETITVTSVECGPAEEAVPVMVTV
jgi:hypothetical protein